MPSQKMTLNDRRHGTVTGYAKGCRCDKCRTVNSAYMREQRAQRFAQLKPEDHGKADSYTNAGCRCDPCRIAANAENLKRKKGSTRYAYGTRAYAKVPKVNLSDLA